MDQDYGLRPDVVSLAELRLLVDAFDGIRTRFGIAILAFVALCALGGLWRLLT